MSKRARQILSLIFGLVLFLAIIQFGGWQQLVQFKQLDYKFLFLAFLATFGITYSMTLRWKRIVETIEPDLRKIKSARYYHYLLLSRISGFIVPKDIGDFATRTLALKLEGKLSLKKSFFSVLLDRLWDFFALALLIIPALSFIFKLTSLWASLLMMILFVLTGYLLLKTQSQRISKLIAWLIIQLAKIRKLKIKKQSPPLIETDFLTISLVKLFFTATRIYFISAALNTNIEFSKLLIVTPLGVLSYLLAFTPGGLGIYEGGWFLILTAIGVDKSQASLTVVGLRIFIYLFILILFSLSWFAINLNKKFPQLKKLTKIKSKTK